MVSTQVVFRSCALHETKRPAFFRPGFANRRATAALIFGAASCPALTAPEPPEGASEGA